MNIVVVMIAGFLGAICRYSVGEWVHIENGFPIGTLVINLVGCFLLSYFLTYISSKKRISPKLSLFVGTGFIGSFTTFSTFSVETIQLLQNRLIFQAIFYVLFSIVLGNGLAYIGYKIARKRSEGAPS